MSDGRPERTPKRGRGRGLGRHTVEVSRPDKGNVDAEVAVVGGAVETQVDAKGDRGPGRVLLAAVEADLGGSVSTCDASRRECGRDDCGRLLALFAGFVFSFSKSLSDCCLDARPLMLAIVLWFFLGRVGSSGRQPREGRGEDRCRGVARSHSRGTKLRP